MHPRTKVMNIYRTIIVSASKMVKFPMSGIQFKITSHAKQQKNTTYNKEKNQREIGPEITKKITP